MVDFVHFMHHLNYLFGNNENKALNGKKVAYTYLLAKTVFLPRPNPERMVMVNR